MDWKSVLKVETEIRRMVERLEKLRASAQIPSPDEFSDPDVEFRPYRLSGPECAAVRRASMDLTRALAELRRW